jgi:hypothetical protein
MAPCSAGPARPAGRRLAGSRSRVPAPGGHARRLWVRARGTDGVEVGDLAVEHAAAGRSPAHHFSRSAAPICAGAASMRSVATTGAILERYEDEPAARRRGWLQLWWAQVCRDRAHPASLLAGSSSGSKHPSGSSRQGADQRERWSRLGESNPRPRITSAELVAITVRTESIDGRHGSIRADAGRTGRQIRGRPPRLLFSSELSNPRPERGVRPCAAPGVVPGAGRPRPAAPPPLEAAPRMAPRMRFRIGMTSLISVHCKSGGGMPEGPLLDLVGCSRNGHVETLG